MAICGQHRIIIFGEEMTNMLCSLKKACNCGLHFHDTGHAALTCVRIAMERRDESLAQTRARIVDFPSHHAAARSYRRGLQAARCSHATW